MKVALDCSTALKLLNDGVDIAFLDRRSPNGTGDNVLTSISERELECRIAIVTCDPPDPEIFEMEFDDYLCAPVTRQAVHRTVQSLLTQEEYEDAITKLYSLASKMAALEAEYPTTELESCQGTSRWSNGSVHSKKRYRQSRKRSLLRSFPLNRNLKNETRSTESSSVGPTGRC